MKIKTIFSLIGITATMAIGALVGLNVRQNSEIKEAKAESNSDWGIVGADFGGGTPSKRVRFIATGANEKPHSVKTITFTSSNWFRFSPDNGWSNTIGWSDVTFGDAKDKFAYFGNDNNLKCNTLGTYDFCIHWNGTSNVIGIFKAGTLNSKKNIYFLHKDWDPDYVYTFNDDGACQKQFGDWNGTKLSEIDNYWGKGYTTTTINLAGSYGNVTSIPLNPFSTDSKVAFNNESGYQSNDTSFTAGSAYYKSGESYGKANLASNANLGAAAAFIAKAESLREAVAANPSKRIAAYSICGISQSDINSLVSDYDSLNSTAQGYVNTTTVKTYTDSYGSEEGIISYSEIVARLRIMASSSSGSNALIPSIATNATSTIIVVTSLISICALGTFFFLKKKKENN